jgi:DNA-binding GntR family transcriptional regulator
VSGLEAVHAAFEEAVMHGDTKTASKADLEFHQRVLAYCQNSCLVEHVERVQARVILATYSTAWGSNQKIAVQEHSRILNALSAHDAIGAERAAVTHLTNLADRIRQEWRHRNGSASQEVPKTN